METEAETLESISSMKLKDEVKDLHCSQLEATINEASIREIQKNENQHLSSSGITENSIKAETEEATDKGIVHHVLEGNDGSFESEAFSESASNANIAIDEISRTAEDCKDKENFILVKNEQDKVMQLENDAVEAKHHIPETAEIEVLGGQNSTAMSLNHAGTEYKELAEPSQLPAEGNNDKDYMIDKLPSLPITSTLVDLSVQEGKLEGGESEVMEENRKMSGNLFNDKNNPMENVQEDTCLIEKYDEETSEAICESQSIKKEKAVSSSQMDEVEDKGSGGDPLIQPGVGQTIGATADHNLEASLVPAPIKESLINYDRSEEATKNPEVSIDKGLEVVACNEGESLHKNNESIPILQEEEIEGKERDTSSNLLITEKGQSIIQTEEIVNEEMEGDGNQQASLSNTCTSTATTSPGIQNSEADNLEDEKSTSYKFEIPSFTTIMEEANSQKAKEEQSGILEYASSFTLEGKEDAEKLKEEASKRHETDNANEYIDKQIIQEEEAINDQSAVSSGEEVVKCIQEDEEEKHDVEESEGLEVAGTSKVIEAKSMEAENVKEQSTGKQEDLEEANIPEKEITMESDTNILSEIHHNTVTEDDGTIQPYSNVSDGEGTVKDNSQEDKRKVKDPIEVFEGLETAGTNEDTEQKIVEDVVFTNPSTEAIAKQTINESEVRVPERLEGAGDQTTEEQITDEEVFKAHETIGAGEDTRSVTLPDICGDTGETTLPDICAVAVGEVLSNEDPQENVKETNSTDSTQRPSTSIATEASEDIHKERNEQLVDSSLLVSEDHIEGESAKNAEITSDKLETESVTLVTDNTSLHQAEQEGVKLIGASGLPSEEKSVGTTDFQARHVEEVKLVENTNLDENANEAILTTEKPEANKAEDDIRYGVIERACVTESGSEYHVTEITTRVEITASESLKDEEENKLFESSTSASKQPEPKIVKAQENIIDETLVEERIQGEKEETPTVVQEKEENFTLKEEICKFEETSKKEPEDLGKETVVEELKKQEPAEYKDAYKTAKETCIDNLEQETAGEIENTYGFETQEKSLDISKSDEEIKYEHATEDEIQDKSKIDISEIVETTDGEVQEQNTEKDGPEVEAKDICINVVNETVDTTGASSSDAAKDTSHSVEEAAASSSNAAQDTSHNVEEAAENLQSIMEEKEDAETREIDSTGETGQKIEVEEFTNLVVLQQNIKKVDSCEKIQSTEIEISDKHHGESSASTNKSGEETDEKNYPEEAQQVVEASKVSRSEAATSEHEASGFKQTSEMEGLQEGRLSEDTSEQMIEENNDADDSSTVHEGKEEHKATMHTSDIPKGDETVTENPHKEEEETNKQEGEIKESKLIPEELSFEPTDSAAETRTVTLEDEEDTNKISAAITVIEVSEEEQDKDNSEKLNEASSLLPKESKEKVEEEILQQPEKTHNKIMETENITALESELDTADVVDSLDLPSVKVSPSCPENVEARVTTFQALDVEDIKLEKTASIIMETEKVSLQESELETTNLVEATNIPSEEMSPDCPSNAEASVTTLHALDVEDIKLGETSSITMETENRSLHESEQETMNLVDATNIPSGKMSPGCLANAEASAATLQTLDVEDIKPGETSPITMETEKPSLHESEQEPMNMVDATNTPYGEMGQGCPANDDASATTLQALDVEDIKLRETTSITMETENISLHESEQETTNLDSTALLSEEMRPDCSANLEASVTNSHALNIEDMKIGEAVSIAKVGLQESELGTTNLVYSSDPPSAETTPGCPGNVEASVTTLQALDVEVEAMKLEETSLITKETEKICLHASENLVDTTDIPSGKMGPGCPANVEASATILQALDVDDMRLEESSSITKEQEKGNEHGSELEPTNLVDSTDLPSGEMSPGSPVNLEASVSRATIIHALDVEDMNLEETSSITKVNLHEPELEPPNLVDSTDPPFGELSPVCPENVEGSATTLDVEGMKLEETSNLNDNANEEILAEKKTDASEAEEGLKYNIMLEEASGTVPEDEQGTEAEITAKICSDDEGEETLQDSSTPKPQVLDSIEAQEKIKDQIPVENETQDEKLEIHSVAKKEEDMTMQQEEKAGKVEEDTKVRSEGREIEYLNEFQNQEGETAAKSHELNPEKHILEKEIAKLTQSSEYSRIEGSAPESEEGNSGGEKKFDELVEGSESTGACACVEKDIIDEGRNENKVVKEVVESEVEDHSHEKNEVSNAKMKGTIIENPEAVYPTKKLTGTPESDAENQSYAAFIETEKFETGEEGNNISISEEAQIVGKNYQEENKKREYLAEAEHKLETEDLSGKINYVNEVSQGFILDAEVLHEVERPEESDKIQKLYADVNDEAVKEVKASDLVSIKQNLQVTDSSEKTETESAADEKDWNMSIVSPITKDSDNELPKIEGSCKLETPSVMVASEERSSEEVEEQKTVETSSIGFEEKSLQTVKTTETSQLGDEMESVNLEERFVSECKLPIFEDENRNQESLTREKLDRDKVEENIREELVVASNAAPQSEGPLEYANPESDNIVVGSLTVKAEEPEHEGHQSSKLEYGEQQLEILVTEMARDNPMIEDAPQNKKNAEIETTSDQNVEDTESEVRELGVFAAIKEKKDEVPIEEETQDTKVRFPSVPMMIERKLSHKEEECKELKESETSSENTEKEVQHAEHMEEENLENAPGLIYSKTDSESTDGVSLLENETEKTEGLIETTEYSGKETRKVNKATEAGLGEDELQSQGYKKSIDGVFQEPETVGASAYPVKDLLENSDTLENENPKEENSEATSRVEKIGIVESENTPKNEDDSCNTTALAEEKLVGEVNEECGDATNVEPEKLMEALESVSEAEIHDMLNETKMSQNIEGGTAVKDLDTVLGSDDRIAGKIQEDETGDNNVREAIQKFETAENQNEKRSEATKTPKNEFAVEEVIHTVNVEKKIEEEEAVYPGQVYGRKTVKDEEYEEQGKEVGDEIKLDLEEPNHDFKAHEMQSEKTYEGNVNTGKEGANQEVVFERSTQKPDLKLVGEETSKDSHQEGEDGEKFGDGVNPSYPTIEGTREHTTDEDPVEEILQEKTEKKLYEDSVQDVVCEDEITNIQIPGQEETEVFLTDERETAERSITASLDELDNTSNVMLEEQRQGKTDFKSGTQVTGTGETKESTKIEDADNLNENIGDMSHTQPLGKEIFDREDTTKLASVAEIEKSTTTTAEEQTSREVNFTESAKEEISAGSTDISLMHMEPIEKPSSKAQVEVQQPEQTSEIESEVKEVERGLEKSTDEPKPSDLDKASFPDHFQISIKEPSETVGLSPGDERDAGVSKKSLENKGELNIHEEEEKSNEGEDKPDQEDEEEQTKGDSGSDAPVMVEASRDVEVKPAHKKSHNILSGMGSKVKHSIAKVKKVITGKSSHHKQSSPKQESDSTVTVKAAADPDL